jgi:pilus assembly protein FimV
VAMAGAATQKIDVKTDDAPVTGSVDLDLDLDFSLDEVSSPSTIIEAQPTRIDPTIAMMAAPPSQPASLDVDFGLATAALDKPTVAAAAAVAQDAAPELSLPDLSMADRTLSLGPNDSDQFRQQAEVSFGSTDPAPLSAPAAIDGPTPEVSFGTTVPNTLTATQAPFNPPESRDSGMLEFDLGTLSLELDSPASNAPAAAAPSEPEDPLATKLALADEFVSIGDDDGARALIEEVIAEASGELKAKAQRALSALG